MSIITLLTLVNLFVDLSANGQISVGCGGFVKNSFGLDLSNVRVKLYSEGQEHGREQGRERILKHETELAPTGYFLIPVFERGKYFFRVSGPDGWVFRPQEIEVDINGHDDRCSQAQDLNFVFTGFSVNGQVRNLGAEVGPAEVSLSLVPVDAEASGAQSKKTVTASNGFYSFIDVVPGRYKISFDQPRYRLATNEVVVDVRAGNTQVPTNSLLVLGYDVFGRFESRFSTSSAGISVILCGSTDKEVLFRKHSLCPAIQDVDLTLTDCGSGRPICITKTSDSGSFQFTSVPSGSYRLVPSGGRISYAIEPQQLDLAVQNEPLILKEAFVISGFAASGLLVYSPAEQTPLPGRTVLLVGADKSEKMAVTDTTGHFVFHKLTTGSYQFRVLDDQLEFEAQTIELRLENDNMGVFFPSKYAVCTRVTVVSADAKCNLQVIPDSGPTEHLAVTVNKTFCSKLAPIKHQLSVACHSGGASISIQPEQTPVVPGSSDQVSVYEFKQFSALVTGQLYCQVPQCDQKFQLSLTATENRAVSTTFKVSPPADAASGLYQYTFLVNAPGTYSVSVNSKDFCFEPADTFAVVPISKTEAHADKAFRLTGWRLFIETSLSSSWELVGRNNLTQPVIFGEKLSYENCLNLHEAYQLVLRRSDCHHFANENMTIIAAGAGQSNHVMLQVSSHLLKGTISSNEELPSIGVKIHTASSDSSELVLEAVRDTSAVPAQGAGKFEGEYTYQFSEWVKTNEDYIVEPQSDLLLFRPKSQTVLSYSLNRNGCLPDMTFAAQRGQFVRVELQPPVEGAQVTIFDGEVPIDSLTYQLDSPIQYGPVFDVGQLSAKAELSGWVFSTDSTSVASGDSTQKPHVTDITVFHITGLKLLDISVTVTDQDTLQPLAGVLVLLVSSSQERAFRQSQNTQTDGSVRFSNIKPDEYYVKAMMKEFRFEPSMNVVNILKEAAELHIKGVRTEFGCSGRVISINGEPEASATLEARGSGSCSERLERATTDQKGNFAIKGLYPDCSYQVKVTSTALMRDRDRDRDAAASSSSGSSSAAAQLSSVAANCYPKQWDIAIRNRTDVTNLLFTTVPDVPTLDISGLVQTEDRYVSSVKVRLYRDSAGIDQDQALHTVQLADHRLFFFPSVPFDGQRYTVRLESTLSSQLFDVAAMEQHFVAAAPPAGPSHVHVHFDFSPKHRSKFGNRDELFRGSWGLVCFLSLVGLVWFFREPLMQKGLSYVNSLSASSSPSSSSQRGVSANTGGSVAYRLKSRLTGLLGASQMADRDRDGSLSVDDIGRAIDEVSSASAAAKNKKAEVPKRVPTHRYMKLKKQDASLNN